MAKRLLTLGLVLCLLAGILAGCGKKEKNPSAQPEDASSPPTVSATASPSPTPAARSAKAARVKVDDLRIRSAASTDSEVLGFASTGSMYALLMETPSDGWYQVEYQGKTAYIYAEYAEVVDVTLEEYNRLKGADGSSSPEGESSAPKSDDPAGASSASSSSSAGSSDAGDEDGE